MAGAHVLIPCALFRAVPSHLHGSAMRQVWTSKSWPVCQRCAALLIASWVTTRTSSDPQVLWALDFPDRDLPPWPFAVCNVMPLCSFGANRDSRSFTDSLMARGQDVSVILDPNDGRLGIIHSVVADQVHPSPLPKAGAWPKSCWRPGECVQGKGGVSCAHANNWAPLKRHSTDETAIKRVG